MIQKPTLMRVPRLGQGEALTHLPAKTGDWVSFPLAVEMARARLRVVPDAFAHTKGVTGSNPTQRGRGRVKFYPSLAYSHVENCVPAFPVLGTRTEVRKAYEFRGATTMSG